jgi:hypothetical protein
VKTFLLMGMLLFVYHLHAEESRPKRSVSLIIADEGIYPESFVAYVGEEVDLFVTATTKLPTCLMLKEKEFIS